MGQNAGDVGGDVDRIKLVVMYSIPFSHDFHSNCIAIGLFKQNEKGKKFQTMYNGKEDKFLFQRKEFYNEINLPYSRNHYVKGQII